MSLDNELSKVLEYNILKANLLRYYKRKQLDHNIGLLTGSINRFKQYNVDSVGIPNNIPGFLKDLYYAATYCSPKYKINELVEDISQFDPYNSLNTDKFIYNQLDRIIQSYAGDLSELYIAVFDIAEKHHIIQELDNYVIQYNNIINDKSATITDQLDDMDNILNSITTKVTELSTLSDDIDLTALTAIVNNSYEKSRSSRLLYEKLDKLLETLISDRPDEEYIANRIQNDIDISTVVTNYTFPIVHQYQITPDIDVSTSLLTAVYKCDPFIIPENTSCLQIMYGLGRTGDNNKYVVMVYRITEQPDKKVLINTITFEENDKTYKSFSTPILSPASLGTSVRLQFETNVDMNMKSPHMTCVVYFTNF
ncbi:hypothetical protein [Scale drop disease virus]|uniref:ORF_002R n=1 Tax=Scale drop disease virus TaxID=1697349 RepID=A0A0K1L632_9VIRU|nr:ORF_002R [Scale drop disease virus]AKU37417.1 ORF_002R [Scale drop disease virus]QLI60671.1 hypothetical protein [Scale drop disease virus]QXJ13589.1 ORF002R [Scale drop disease virus]UNH60784.1 hypothetical protein SDDV_ORF115 [Scale drop disease virus]